MLDPPKFAPTAAHAERAARAYKGINRLGLKLLAPGGLLLTFSCSGEASNFLSLLDDLADNYPSIQLQNFSITTRSFAAADGTSSSGSIYNVTLRVVLCDKGGVQP